MAKKYVVQLTAKERQILREVVTKLNGSSQKVRWAQMLLKADEAGPAWTDERIAEAFDSRTRTVEKLRERFVTEGFEQTLNGKKRDKPPTEKILSGKQEARVIALRLSAPPKGYANWTLRLLARRMTAGCRVGDCRFDQPCPSGKPAISPPQQNLWVHSGSGKCPSV